MRSEPVSATVTPLPVAGDAPSADDGAGRGELGNVAAVADNDVASASGVPNNAAWFKVADARHKRRTQVARGARPRP